MWTSTERLANGRVGIESSLSTRISTLVRTTTMSPKCEILRTVAQWSQRTSGERQAHGVETCPTRIRPRQTSMLPASISTYRWPPQRGRHPASRKASRATCTHILRKTVSPEQAATGADSDENPGSAIQNSRLSARTHCSKISGGFLQPCQTK